MCEIMCWLYWHLQSAQWRRKGEREWDKRFDRTINCQYSERYFMNWRDINIPPINMTFVCRAYAHFQHINHKPIQYSPWFVQCAYRMSSVISFLVNKHQTYCSMFLLQSPVKCGKRLNFTFDKVMAKWSCRERIDGSKKLSKILAKCIAQIDRISMQNWCINKSRHI